MQSKSKREVINAKVSDLTYVPSTKEDIPTIPELLDVRFNAATQTITFVLAGSENVQYQAEGSAPLAIPGKLVLSYFG